MKKAKVGVTALNALMEAAGSTVSTEVLMEATKASHKAQNLKAVDGGKKGKGKDDPLAKQRKMKFIGRKAMKKELSAFIRKEEVDHVTKGEFLAAVHKRIGTHLEVGDKLNALKAK